MARRSYRGGCYVWRTNKPGAVVGLPIIGRHFAYVGRTRSFQHRKRQHLGTPLPNDPFATNGKPWCDLKPRCYEIPMWGWLSHMVEPVLIWLLFPVYNVQYNKHNPRRISQYRALKMRARRDAHRTVHPFTAVAINGLMAVRWWHVAGVLAFLSCLGWGVVR